MLFPAFVQSHILKGVATVSSFVFISLLLINPSSFVSQNDVSANFLYNDDRDGIGSEDNIINPDDVSIQTSQNNYENPLLSYVLKSGDTLSSIAQKYGISVSKIKTLNNIVDDTTIRPGQTIYISQTDGFVYKISDIPISPLIFSNMYFSTVEEKNEFMRVNGRYDEMQPISVGSAVIIPHKTLAQAYAMGLLKEPQKPVKVIAATSPSKSPTRIVSTRPVSGPVRQGAGGSKVIKSRKYSFKENNGMIAGYCTYYAAHMARWAFPQLKGNNYFRGLRGNANAWLGSAQANGLKTSKTPSVGAIVVFQNGGARNYSAGHVAIVIDVDREKKQMKVEEMNYVGFGVVNQRLIDMNDSMTEAVNNKQDIMGFIPVQALSPKLNEQYQALLK